MTLLLASRAMGRDLILAGPPVTTPHPVRFARVGVGQRYLLRSSTDDEYRQSVSEATLPSAVLPLRESVRPSSGAQADHEGVRDVS